jgi:broad specificity phosphatase PhoE
MPHDRVVLVKHAQPVLDATEPARKWSLAAEGEAQSRRLAGRIRAFMPCRFVSSPEPKALRTCEIVAGELGMPMTTVAELREIDRRVLPIMPPPEHEALNARIFSEFDQRVVGCESAREAQERFSAAVLGALRETDQDNLVVLAHGTVISLFVSAHNRVDAYELWRRLQCPSFVVLERSSLALVDVVADAGAVEVHPS